MTVQQPGAGAASDRARHWHGINWAGCHREVRRLQARIVKAIQGEVQIAVTREQSDAGVMVDNGRPFFSVVVHA